MTTDTPAAAPITAEREAFEKWCVTEGWVERPSARANGTYINGALQARWLAWQARARLSAPVAAQPAASGVDALWDERLKVRSGPFKDRLQVWFTRAEVIAILDEALRAHLSTALTGAAKE